MSSMKKKRSALFSINFDREDELEHFLKTKGVQSIDVPATHQGKVKKVVSMIEPTMNDMKALCQMYGEPAPKTRSIVMMRNVCVDAIVKGEDIQMESDDESRRENSKTTKTSSKCTQGEKSSDAVQPSNLIRHLSNFESNDSKKFLATCIMEGKPTFCIIRIGKLIRMYDVSNVSESQMAMNVMTGIGKSDPNGDGWIIVHDKNVGETTMKILSAKSDNIPIKIGEMEYYQILHFITTFSQREDLF